MTQKQRNRDRQLIAEIGTRAAVLFGHDRMTFIMDVTTCHAKTPINLKKLMAFEDADFGHDMSGINRHLDRVTGKLRDCFWPRCGGPT